MGSKKQAEKSNKQILPPPVMPAGGYHGRIVASPDHEKHLDPVQLHRLEQSFRDWAAAARRQDVRASRKRILIIFLLIRYTGAKLNEVLELDPLQDIDFKGQFVRFGRAPVASGRTGRKVPLSDSLSREIRTLIGASDPAGSGFQYKLNVDPGFVRRKFYERAEACGLAKQLGAPEVLRKSRAVELMQNNMPLPAVQMILGHSTPNLTSSYVSFSEDDIQRVTKFFMEKESARKTSARNTFLGKIITIQPGDIQTLVTLMTIGGQRITTVITNASAQRLGLKVGKLITAEVKAPWVMLQKTENEPESSADNVFAGTIEKINTGRINSEYLVCIADGTEVCSIVTSESSRRLNLGPGDKVWVLFNGFSVMLLED